MKKKILTRVVLPILIGVASAVLAWFIMDAIEAAKERHEKEITEPLYDERQSDRISYLENKCELGINKDVEHDIELTEIATKLDNMNKVLYETRTDVKEISRSIMELKQIMAYEPDTTDNWNIAVRSK